MAMPIEEKKRRQAERAKRLYHKYIEASRAKQRARYAANIEESRRKKRESYERNLESSRARDRRRKAIQRATRKAEVLVKQRDDYRRNRASRIATITTGRLRRNPGRGLTFLLRDMEAGRVSIREVSEQLGLRIALAHEADSRHDRRRSSDNRSNRASGPVRTRDRAPHEVAERTTSSDERLGDVDG